MKPGLHKAVHVVRNLVDAMKVIKNLIFVAFVLNVISCVGYDVGNYDFVTKAIYVGPKSNTKAEVLTYGYVPRDADIAESFELKVKILYKDGMKDSIAVKNIVGSDYYEVMLPNQRTELTYFEMEDHILEHMTFKIDPDEALELVNAIFSTTSGPKGTYMKNQAKSILVDTVNFTIKNR
jgi:hypothetical protein